MGLGLIRRQRISEGPRERARELTHALLLPRARDLDAPLLVSFAGPTGSVKSSLLNTLAEHR